MVYRDKPVLIFTLFSAATHMAAQIAVKAYIPVISLSSGDSTLTQARLPWIFRMTPDCKTQAATLLRHCTERNLNRIGIISTIRQEPRVAAKDFVDTLTEHGMQPLFHYQLVSAKNNWVEALKQTAGENPGAQFAAADRHEIVQVIGLLNKHNIRCPLYFCWTPGLNWQTAAK